MATMLVLGEDLDKPRTVDFRLGTAGLRIQPARPAAPLAEEEIRASRRSAAAPIS